MRVLAQHDNDTASMGTPCLLRGVAVVAAFSGYSFGLLQKSNSPAVRIPQTLTKSTNANIKKQSQITPNQPIDLHKTPSIIRPLKR